MAKMLIVYWSGTGNTARMAELVKEGAAAAGAEVALLSVSEAAPEAVAEYDVIALGCPSMGSEVLEEGEMEPFVAALADKVAGKRLALFGSYDWGDGQWMRDWADRMRDCKADLVDDGLIAHLTPDAEGEEKCRDLGRRAAG